jgi:hypothetical protein
MNKIPSGVMPEYNAWHRSKDGSIKVFTHGEYKHYLKIKSAWEGIPAMTKEDKIYTGIVTGLIIMIAVTVFFIAKFSAGAQHFY